MFFFHQLHVNFLCPFSVFFLLIGIDIFVLTAIYESHFPDLLWNFQLWLRCFFLHEEIVYILNVNVDIFISLCSFMISSAFSIMLIKLFSSLRLHKCVSIFYLVSSFVHLNLYL